MHDERVGWEGWIIAVIALAGIPAGLLFFPIIGGIAGGTDYSARPVPTTLAPALAPARLMIGIGVAVALATIAGWLIRRTDWETPVQ